MKVLVLGGTRFIGPPAVNRLAAQGHEQDWDLDPTRIRTELGYAEVTPPDTAMSRTIAWQRENQPAEFDAAAFNYPAEDAAFRR